MAYGWRQAALAESANEVFRRVRELHEKLGLLGNRFDKLGRALRELVTIVHPTTFLRWLREDAKRGKRGRAKPHVRCDRCSG